MTETVAWALCPCVSDLRPMGRVERPCNRRMATYYICTIVTGEPNELVAQIHTRMPVIL